MAQNGPGDDQGGGREAASARAARRAAERAARQAANRAERQARRAARQAERAGRRGAEAEEDRAEAGGPSGGQHHPRPAAATRPFNILLVGQGMRLGGQAALFAASLRRNAPGWRGRLIVAEPQPGGAWCGAQTRMPETARAALAAFGAEILPFTATHFGAGYPYGNKIEALALLPPGEPFVFFDSDTLVTGPLERLSLDFARPSASMRRSATWPEPPPYGPGYGAIWKSLYDRFGLDYESSLDRSQPDEHWERYLYFNAGWFFGADPQEFGRRFLDWALAIRDDPGEALACQSLDPWLDQVALPLVIHSLGGGRPGPELAGLDGWATCHYRNLSLLYARESDAVVALIEELAADPRIAPLLADDEAARHLIAEGAGRSRIRPLFAGEDPPPTEKAMRQRLRRAGLWFR
ncbi:hypothetical protein NM680_10890 [Paracoccus sp. PS-1]|uniref:hypothetical protein n=1 Tax=unclassified Paracoccus (in: a-proteobacteria) TaxID=2688777 RepID=UPI000A0044D4|nr:MULTISPECIES: hypothetical protein [unclassified Paracoccus (in: a-proteobacteria)]MDQ7262298.1 hypothetical protein [Paracoccus sp. PS1]